MRNMHAEHTEHAEHACVACKGWRACMRSSRSMRHGVIQHALLDVRLEPELDIRMV